MHVSIIKLFVKINCIHLAVHFALENCMLRLLGQLEASALKDDLILVVSTFAELYVSTMKNDACVNRETWFYCNSVNSER